MSPAISLLVNNIQYIKQKKKIQLAHLKLKRDAALALKSLLLVIRFLVLNSLHCYSSNKQL